MEKKILALMVSLLVIAAVAVAVTMVSFGGIGRAGGFTKLFDSLEYTGTGTYNQRLSLPDSWHENDVKKVSDRIVDMKYKKEVHGTASLYETTFWFVYVGEKWNDPRWGTSFFVPDTSNDGWLEVNHGLFSISVWTATNLSAEYDIGDVISLEVKLEKNDFGVLALGTWLVSDVL
ncbi:MAG: hypothetical protein QXJ32_08405 [Thermoplasmata archaeon]